MKAQLQRLKKVLIKISGVEIFPDEDDNCQKLASGALEPKYVEQQHTKDCLCDMCLSIDDVVKDE